jgi:hypothetical protein
MNRVRLRSLVVLIALVATILPGAAPIAASSGADSRPVSQHDRCTLGDAHALLEVHPIPAIMVERGQDHRGLIDAYLNCQYRLFKGGSHTFCEDDIIVGGALYLWDYKASGISRTDAIAELQRYTSRVWLDGVEQVLHLTAYKDFTSPSIGTTVYQHRAFMIQLPPGDHVSLWVESYLGVPVETVTVDLHILPSELCG